MASVAVGVGDTLRALGHLRPDTWLGGEHVELRLLEAEVAR
jgi:hypothetical protein